jgi:hypothetical protein
MVGLLPYPRVSFHIDKTNNFFSQKMIKFFFWNIYIFHHLLYYCDISSEIIQNVDYDNFDNFQHVNFIFSQNFIALFWGLFNDETDLRVRYLI